MPTMLACRCILLGFFDQTKAPKRVNFVYSLVHGGKSWWSAILVGSTSKAMCWTCVLPLCSKVSGKRNQPTSLPVLMVPVKRAGTTPLAVFTSGAKRNASFTFWLRWVSRALVTSLKRPTQTGTEYSQKTAGNLMSAQRVSLSHWQQGHFRISHFDLTHFVPNHLQQAPAVQ